METSLESLNSSMFLVGIMMLVLNIWSRYIVHEFSETDEEYKTNIILRRIAIFAVCFVGTRDVVVSLILTAAFVVLSTGMYHVKSVYAREGMTPATTAAAVAMSAY
jgi:hypothetical protein